MHLQDPELIPVWPVWIRQTLEGICILSLFFLYSLYTYPDEYMFACMVWGMFMSIFVWGILCGVSVSLIGGLRIKAAPDSCKLTDSEAGIVHRDGLPLEIVAKAASL